VLLVDDGLQSAELALLLPRAATRSDGVPAAAVRLLPSEAMLRSLLDAAQGGTRCSLAVDVPFGWPDEHATFTGSWSAVSKISQGALPSRDEFERRLCDREFRRAFDGLMPFAVGADSIAQAAFVWCKTLQELGNLAGSIDVGVGPLDHPVATFETYPAAFVRNVMPQYINYKSIPEQRSALLASLVGSGYPLRVENAGGASAIHETEWCRWAINQRGSPDAFDALLCAFTAWDHLRYRFGQPGTTLSTPQVVLGRALANSELERVMREGWILVQMPRTTCST